MNKEKIRIDNLTPEQVDKKLKNNNLNLLKEMRCLASCNDSECDTNGCKKLEK